VRSFSNLPVFLRQDVLMRAFGDYLNRLNTFMVMERVVALLRGRPRLLEGFNLFLPPGYRITTTSTAIIVASPTGTQWYPLPAVNSN